MKKHKKSYNNNKFKISAPTWNDKLRLPDGSYFVPNIQDYFNYILKNHNENIDNPSIRIYANRIEKRITFKIKTRFYLKFVTSETMKLLASTENKITEDKNCEKVAHLEIKEVVLIYHSIVNNDYQQDSRVLYTLVPNEPIGNLLETSPTNFVFLKTFKSEFQASEVWCTDHNSKPLEIEDKINFTLLIK